MNRVLVDDEVELRCQDLGNGPVVVLVHGGCMSHRVWESQVDALLEAGFRVVTPDLRGHGRSDKPQSSYSAAMHAADIGALIGQLGVESVSLVGWSLGATLAAIVAGRDDTSIDSLVLVASSIFERLAADARGESVDSSLPLEKMLANQRSDRPRGMERFVTGMFGGTPDDWTRQWLWSIGMETPMRVAIKTLRIYADLDPEALAANLRRFDGCGAVFHGALDRGATLADAATVATGLFEDGMFVSFERSGHVPFLEESLRFNEELIGCLNRRSL